MKNKYTPSFRSFAILVALAIVGYIFIANSVPFSISRVLISNHKNTLVLGPKKRVEVANGISKQTDNLIYFNSKMDFKFDHVRAKIAFKNPSSDQQIQLGYRDQTEWHYNAQTLDSPILDNLSWSKVGKGPYLYQKVLNYKNIDDFLKNPPQNKIVGISDYKEDLQTSNRALPNYKPSTNNTSISVPLRGKITMYAYLDHEPFNMSFTKQDLNWYSDPDAAKISVYKGKDRVFVATIDDDGNNTSNQKPGFKQTVNIKNPGPGLPESGIYKIVIDASDDSIITNITTNLHKIVFEGPLYVADNHEVYGNIIPSTKPTNIITNAQSLSFKSDHNHSTLAKINQQIIKTNKPNKVITTTTSTPLSTITIPRSDMMVNGSGYFAFIPDQFFAPIPFNILPINSAEDIARADYLLTDYKTPKHEGDWLVAEREFDLNDAAIQKGQLSWLLNAPGLKENKRTVEYKNIVMTLSKKGWFKQ
jgi:hypothetical protein